MFQEPEDYEERDQVPEDGEELSQALHQGEENQDIKPQLKLNLIIHHEQQEITVRVKVNMPFRKIIDAATERFLKQPGTLRFLYNGARIMPTDTPEGLSIEDGDHVDAQLEQVGGGHGVSITFKDYNSC